MEDTIEISKPEDRLYLIGDTETAGLGESKVACEIGLIQFHPVTLEIINTWGSLLDPQIPIQEGARAIHGISNEMVADEPTMDEFITHKLNGQFQQDIVLICHNVSFDLPLLQPLGSVVDTFCTMLWARQLVSGSPNHKLQTLREFFGLPVHDAHRALGDCRTTLDVLRELVKLSGKPFLDLLKVKDQTVHTMPWGKHKGKKLLSLPKDYLEWLRDLPDLDRNLKASVTKALKLK